jgi:hypothetical protein
MSSSRRCAAHGDRRTAPPHQPPGAVTTAADKFGRGEGATLSPPGVAQRIGGQWKATWGIGVRGPSQEGGGRHTCKQASRCRWLMAQWQAEWAYSLQSIQSSGIYKKGNFQFGSFWGGSYSNVGHGSQIIPIWVGFHSIRRLCG